MPAFRITNNEISQYTAALYDLHRSGIPVAVRATLNRAAFDVKQNTMPHETDMAFIKRKPTFFKATSSVNPASGLQTGSMRSEVGFIAPGNVKESGHATKDLEEQEEGGDIDKRAFIATKQSRSARGNVKDAFTMAKIKRLIINSRNARGKTDGEQFIKSAIYAGVGGFVIGTNTNAAGNRALLRIQSVKRVGSDTVVKTKQVYSVKGKRKAHVKATHFMATAADESAGKMNGYFIEEAEKFWVRMQVKKAFPAIKP